MLGALGVPTTFFGPHSTRGAGVKLYRELGFSSEEVCEIGKWKNAKAFGKHYSRLGTVTAASRGLTSFLAGTNFGVHNVSPGDCAEPDLSRTPGNGSDLGGRDGEGEAQDTGEPTRKRSPPSNSSASSSGFEPPSRDVPATFTFAPRRDSNVLTAKTANHRQRAVRRKRARTHSRS